MVTLVIKMPGNVVNEKKQNQPERRKELGEGLFRETEKDGCLNLKQKTTQGKTNRSGGAVWR